MRSFVSKSSKVRVWMPAKEFPTPKLVHWQRLCIVTVKCGMLKAGFA